MANYVWPLKTYTETQHYHNPGPYGGIDIAAPQGTPVYSIADGVVTRIGAQGFGPYYVEIQHPNGVVSYYGHNASATVSVGQHVSQGQQIGTVGNLGISHGPHVHFGIRVNGNDVNPDNFMNGAGTAQTVGLPNPLNIPGDILGALTGAITGPLTDVLKKALGFIVNGLEVVGGFLLMALGISMIFAASDTGKAFTQKVVKVAGAAAIAR